MEAKKNTVGNMKDFFSSEPSTLIEKTKNVVNPKLPQEPSVLPYVSGNDVLDAEIKWVLKSVNSHYSFNSAEGISSLFKDMFPDSNIAKQFACSATKCAYLVCFGIAPHFKSALFKCVNELDDYTILFDESLNHSTQLKQMDIHVRFWGSTENKVKTRYCNSMFLGHSTADVTVSAILKAIENLNFAKVLNLSMDGPAVNWKAFELLQKEMGKETGTKMINVGSCGLHTLHNCFKDGYESTTWDIDSFLVSLYWLFKDSPARREDYLSLSKSSKMPKRFCKHRWLENGPAAERALEIWEDVKDFVRSVEKGKFTKPKCKSFHTICEACEDVFMPVKLNFFLSMTKILQPFLIAYQSDSPLLPFMANDLQKLAVRLLQNFNVMKKEKLRSIATPSKLASFDFSDKSCYTGISQTSLGFAGDKVLKEILRTNSNISEKQVLELKHDGQGFVYKVVQNMISKAPIKYALVRQLACLDPQKMISDSHGCYLKMKHVLSVLADSKKVQEDNCDSILLEFQEFLNEISTNSSEFESFDRATSNLDTFLWKYFNGQKKYENIWHVMKKLLIIPHGQAAVERGFSVNKQVEAENLSEASFVAKRIIIDEIRSSGGLENISITKELRLAASGARKKYVAFLEEERKKKSMEMERRKRKNCYEELEQLKSKKARLEQAANGLQESADKLAEKAEKTGSIQLIMQSNSFRRTAKEKLEEVRKVDNDITNLLKELKS